jgi:hypothetical protein
MDIKTGNACLLGAEWHRSVTWHAYSNGDDLACNVCGETRNISTTATTKKTTSTKKTTTLTTKVPTTIATSTVYTTTVSTKVESITKTTPVPSGTVASDSTTKKPQSTAGTMQQPTSDSTAPTQSTAPTASTVSTTTTVPTQAADGGATDGGIPLWLVIVVAVAGLAIGCGVGFILKKK